MPISEITGGQSAEIYNINRINPQTNSTVNKDSIFINRTNGQQNAPQTEYNDNKEIFNADEYDVENDPYSDANSAQDERIAKIQQAGNKFNNIKRECIESMTSAMNSDAYKMAGMVSRGELEGNILTEKNGTQHNIYEDIAPQLVDMAFNTAIEIANDDSLTDEEKEAKYNELEAQMRAMTKSALAEINAVTADINGTTNDAVMPQNNDENNESISS